jgi:hypothetical protein
VLADVLAKRADAAFLLANRQFQLFVQAMDGFVVLRTEHVHQERRYLSQIAKDIFYFAAEAVEFGAFAHCGPNSVSGDCSRRIVRSSPLQEFSGAEYFTDGNHSEVLNVLVEKNSKFGENQPRVAILDALR